MKITKDWLLLILPHALWALLILLVADGLGLIHEWLSAFIAAPLILLHGEIKEEEGKMKQRGEKTGTLRSIKEVLLSQSRTMKERSEWLWMGALAALVYNLIVFGV